MNKTLTAEEALALLPDGEVIHTFRGIFGADWSRHEVIKLINDAELLQRSSGFHLRNGHGLAAREVGGRWIYIETKDAGEGQEG